MRVSCVYVSGVSEASQNKNKKMTKNGQLGQAPNAVRQSTPQPGVAVTIVPASININTDLDDPLVDALDERVRQAGLDFLRPPSSGFDGGLALVP